jgi:hypothetical protein
MLRIGQANRLNRIVSQRAASSRLDPGLDQSCQGHQHRHEDQRDDREHRRQATVGDQETAQGGPDQPAGVGGHGIQRHGLRDASGAGNVTHQRASHGHVAGPHGAVQCAGQRQVPDFDRAEGRQQQQNQADGEQGRMGQQQHAAAGYPGGQRAQRQAEQRQRQHAQRHQAGHPQCGFRLVVVYYVVVYDLDISDEV